MTDRITSARDIPTAPYYVTTTDTFMSGWGPARNKINKLVFPCETYAEACKIQAYATKQRTDQKYVNIRSTKPNVTNPAYYWQLKTRIEYPHWYNQED